MAKLPIFLPGEFPWTEEPGGLQSMGRKELFTIEQLRTAQQTHSVFNTRAQRARSLSSSGGCQ